MAPSNGSPAGRAASPNGGRERGPRARVLPAITARALTVPLGLLTLAYGLLYAGTFARLAGVWWSRDDFSHGFLIPLISAYIVWLNRDRLAGIARRPAPGWGVAVVAASGALRVVGSAAGVIALEGLSAVTMLVGVILVVAGPAFARALAFPLAYLVFMVPVFDGFVSLIQWPFQLMTARMGVALLQGMGYAVLLERQFIALPSVTLEVAQVCSGVNYLVSVLAVGLPVAYVVLSRWWTRAGLVVSALAIGVAANWVRVAFIGMWAYAGGEVSHGPFHVFQGLVVAWIGFIALFIGAWGLAGVERRLGPVRRGTGDPPVANGAPAPGGPARSRWVVAVVVVMAACWLVAAAAKPAPVDLAWPINTFPAVFDGWRMAPANPDAAVFRLLKADEELVRVYRTAGGLEATVYIGFIRSSGSGKEVVSYWTAPLHARASPVAVDLPSSERASVNRGEWEGKQGRYRIWFWYEVGGREMAGRYEAKAAALKNALVRGRGDEALILVAQRDDGGADGPAVAETEALVRGVLAASGALWAEGR